MLRNLKELLHILTTMSMINLSSNDNINKINKKAKHCSICNCRKIIGYKWHREGDFYLCRKCWPLLHPTAEWFEKRYNALHSCLGEILSGDIPIFTPLGKAQAHIKVEDGEWLTKRVIERLDLPTGNIKFKFKKMEKNIAGNVKSIEDGYVVNVSQELQDNFHALSAILIHELMHIYLCNHGMVYKSQEELEELTDLACVLLGFGLPMINAKHTWQVKRGVLGDNSLIGGLSYHIIGYLSEEKIGYAFSYFLSHTKKHKEDIRDKIDPQCWHIIENGIALEKHNHDRFITRRKTQKFLTEKFFKNDICEFTCPVCFLKMGIPYKTIERIGIFNTICRRCGTKIQFDGEKIIRFIESLK